MTVETAVKPARSVRSAIERMGADAEVLARFHEHDARPELVVAKVRDRPAYADRRFVTSDGLESFLGNLPLMTKAELRRQFPDGFLPHGTGFAALIESEEVIVVRTSGTSGDRLQVLWDADWWEDQEWAAFGRHPLIGPQLNDEYREAVLTTPLCSENVCHSGPVPMEERQVGHLLFLNTQHDPTRWAKADLERMIEELRTFRPLAIEADPVYLAALARHIRDSGTAPPPIGWIILSYEFVTARDKELIRSVFRCPVYECYGLTEAGVFFLECSAGRHHFCGSDAVIELLRPPGLTLPPGIGEIVATTWGNAAQPLLRYRTGDLGLIAEGDCPCGAPGPTLLSFEGRIRDLLEFADGGACTPRQIDRALDGAQGLVGYQCVQQGDSALQLRFVGEGPGDPGDELRTRLRTLGWPVEIDARRVAFLSPEPSGKYRTVIPA